MAGVTATITTALSATLAGTADVGTPRYAVREDTTVQFSPGTATTGQADIMFADTRTLAASATENLDLAGSLTNAFGATITAAEIMLLDVQAAAGNTNDVVVGGAASNAFVGPLGGTTPTIAVKPGERVTLVSKAGWPVTAGTGDILKVTNGGGTTPVSYTVTLIGRTVAA